MIPHRSWTSHLKDIAPSADITGVSSWLSETGSMTARLRRHWPALQVDVLDEGLRTPLQDERERLNMGNNLVCWVREVLLREHGQPLVSARTVILDWSDRNPWQEVATLGQRPLGELLFSLPDLQRSPLEFTFTHPCIAPHCTDTRMVPARRRVFFREGMPLLLTEAFHLLAERFATAEDADTAMR